MHGQHIKNFQVNRLRIYETKDLKMWPKKQRTF